MPKPQQEPRLRAVGQTRLSPPLKIRLGFAWFFLVLEKLAPALLPFLCVLGVFAALALLDILPRLPAWLHLFVLCLLLVGAATALWRGLWRFRFPSLEAAKRRLETDSDVRHRPLTGLDDQAATVAGDRASAELWHKHRQKMKAQLAKLRLKAPKSHLAAADPFAVRAAVALIVFIAVAVGYQDWQPRLGKALAPNFAFAQERPERMDVWINPPAYTALPPRFLDPLKPEPLKVPAGSEVLAQVQSNSQPTLRLGETEVPFEALSDRAYQVRHTVTDGSQLTIEQNGSAMATWPLEIIADTPPVIDFGGKPQATERQSLRIDYEAVDDYGVSEVRAVIRRLDDPEAEPIELEIILSGADRAELTGSSYHDLTPHPWAGLAVDIQLVATDAIGQEGESQRERTVLPEREFRHPVARALVELRKQLTTDPKNRLPVVQELGALVQRPETFFHDTTVALALYVMNRRLVHDGSAGAIDQVQDLMWETALRIEEGELSLAERDLREAQEALMEALARNAEQAEIERLMDQLQTAMDNFLEALTEQLREQMEAGQSQDQPPPNAQQLRAQDLQDLLDRARELAKSGAMDAARELLSQLQNILENLQVQPYGEAMSGEMQDASRMMRTLERMLQDQEELLDRSYQRSQEAKKNQGEATPDEQGNQSDSQSQEKLRQELGDLMRELGEMLGDIPGPLGRAEGEMRDARNALERNKPGQAVRPQTRSLDHMQQGLQSMADRFMQMFSEGQDQGSGNVGARPGQGQGPDPLGRQLGQGSREAIEGVQIPEEMELQRAREILEELRRRRNEPQRPPVELDYIDRLLRQF